MDDLTFSFWLSLGYKYIWRLGEETQALTGIRTYGLAFTYHLLCKSNYCENYRVQLNLETEDIWLKHRTQNPKEACGL